MTGLGRRKYLFTPYQVIYVAFKSLLPGSVPHLSHFFKSASGPFMTRVCPGKRLEPADDGVAVGRIVF